MVITGASGSPTSPFLEVHAGWQESWAAGSRPTLMHHHPPKSDSRLGSRLLRSPAPPTFRLPCRLPRSAASRPSAKKLRVVASWPLRSKLPITDSAQLDPRPPVPCSWTWADSQTEQSRGPAVVQTSVYRAPWPAGLNLPSAGPDQQGCGGQWVAPRLWHQTGLSSNAGSTQFPGPSHSPHSSSVSGQ